MKVKKMIEILAAGLPYFYMFLAIDIIISIKLSVDKCLSKPTRVHVINDGPWRRR